MQPEMPCRSKELAELLGGPALRAAALSQPRPWGLRSERRIHGDEVLADRLGERGADHDVDVVHGLRCETGPPHPAGGEQFGVEAVEVFGSNGAQWH